MLLDNRTRPWLIEQCEITQNWRNPGSKLSADAVVIKKSYERFKSGQNQEERKSER